MFLRSVTSKTIFLFDQMNHIINLRSLLFNIINVDYQQMLNYVSGGNIFATRLSKVI